MGPTILEHIVYATGQIRTGFLCKGLKLDCTMLAAILALPALNGDSNKEIPLQQPRRKACAMTFRFPRGCKYPIYKVSGPKYH